MTAEGLIRLRHYVDELIKAAERGQAPTGGSNMAGKKGDSHADPKTGPMAETQRDPAQASDRSPGADAAAAMEAGSGGER